MVYVTEDDLGLDIVFQFMQMHGLYCCLSTNGHKDRCLYVAMVCVDKAGTCIRLRVVMFEGECHLSFL